MIIFGVVLMVVAGILWLITLFRAPVLGDIGAGIQAGIQMMMLGIVFVIGLISSAIGLIAKFVK